MKTDTNNTIRRFAIERSIAKLVNKSTLLKVLRYIDTNNIKTPCLVIDRDKIQENISLIGSRIDNCKVFYAVKANPDIEILKILNEAGVGFEIASEGELKILSELGVDPHNIITSNPVKSPHFLKYAVSYGVNYFAYDSLAEVEKLAEIAPACNVYVRLSVPNEGSEWPLSKKFGVEIEIALSLLIKAKEKGLKPVGITFHVGSQCTNIYNWNIAIDKARLLWDMAEKEGIRLTLLNLGGGYPIRYTKNVITIQNIETKINKLLKERFSGEITIHIEPGRSVVGDAGVLITSVIGKAVRSDENWLYINVGVFNGLLESLGGIKYSYIPETHDKPVNKKNFILAGPSCDSFDIIDENVTIHETDVGDLIIIPSGGAYTTSYASEFNGFSIPETIVI